LGFQWPSLADCRSQFDRDLLKSRADAALAEAEYELDALKADGVAMLTSYDDKWLGDPALAPLYDELDRRHVTIFVHPTIAACCDPKLPFIRTAVIEDGADTTRAMANFVYRGAARRFRQLSLVFCHAGGVTPFLIERFDFTDRNTPAVRVGAPDGFRAEIRRFFFDTAQSSNPVAMRALRGVVPVTQILFGTDYPFRNQLEYTRSLQPVESFPPAR
jgi:6-methylsalicylate decarboxylase